MNEVLKIFLSMSFSGGLLILALFLGKRFLKDKISRQWQYYIWMVVILRLLLPFGTEVSLLGKTYQAVDQAITQIALLPPQQQYPLTTPGGNLAPVVGIEQSNRNMNSPTKDLTTVHPIQEIGTLLTDHVWLIWPVVALTLLIRKATIYQSFMRYIKAGLTPVSDIEILDQLSITAEQAGIKRPAELCVNPLISSPLLIGFFHPCIVLPNADISEKAFQYIVLHELTHYKRRDMFYKWLVQITACLHWFNPLVHLMSREITKACEFSCDEAVLAKIGSGNAQDYGKILLDAMAAVGRYKENLGAVTLSENKQLLKERLAAIMNFKKQSKAVKSLTVMLTLFVVVGASFAGIYTVGNTQAASIPNAPVDTAGRPSLSLAVSGAAVNVLAAENDTISAEYNRDVYTVNISQQNRDWKVLISCKTSTNINDETIKLYLPNVDYGDVKLKADNGYLTCGLIRSGNIVGNFNMASVFLTLPEGFSGSVNVIANSGYFQLVSQDDFKNTTATITDNGDWGEIYKPKNFKENGNTSTFTDGTGANTIRVTRKGSGVMGIYTSHASDTSNYPDEWKELWQDQWQGKPWEDDWWQNTWREDDTPNALSTAPDKQSAKTNGTSSNISSDIEQYYQADSLPLFQIAFPRLDREEQLAWLEKIYADGDMAFFSVAVRGLDTNSSVLTGFAEKVYENADIAFFSTLADCMDETELEFWLDRTLEDENWAFQSVLFDKLDRKDEFDQLEAKREKEWTEAQMAEYEAAGVTMADEKTYYYQGQLINIFLDIRKEGSFYTLNMNPAGTVNIKITRDANNKITGVAYMTEAEAAELLGDMDDPG